MWHYKKDKGICNQVLYTAEYVLEGGFVSSSLPNSHKYTITAAGPYDDLSLASSSGKSRNR